MSASHYFSSPEGEFERRRVEVELLERRLELSTAAGIFSPEGVDKGTRVLLEQAAPPAGAGNLLDIGCGWGPMALTMAMRSPAARVWAVDVNERARTLCAENAKALGVGNVRVLAPQDVPADLRFSTIWSNPPIRVGKKVLHEILLHWLPRLDQQGQAHLVVQKNLGADSLQTWLAAELGEEYDVARTGSHKGFRLLRVARQ